MTSQLYRKIYYEQGEHRKPLLFDQSPFDYGKLWLKPLKKEAALLSQAVPSGDMNPKDSSIQIDLKLHMSSMPDEFMLSELARAMQYLPHVERLDFEHLHAPDAELREYIRGLAKTVALRPLIWKLRQRLQAKRLRRQGVEPNVDTECPSQSPFHLKRRDTSLYDWSASKLVTVSKDHPEIEKNITPSLDTSYPQNQLDLHSVVHDTPLEAARPHYLGSVLSIAYTIDASGLQDRVRSKQNSMRRYWQATTIQERLSFCGLWLLLISCYLMTQSETWRMLFD